MFGVPTKDVELQFDISLMGAVGKLIKPNLINTLDINLTSYLTIIL